MPHALRLFLAAPTPCSYLDNVRSSALFVDPDAIMSSAIYGQLAEQGFRRSGSGVYRPHCHSCQACKAVRVAVADFKISRQQRRTWNKNRDLTITATTTPNRQEHLALFACYVKSRHQGGGMDNTDGDTTFEFFQSPWGETLFYEFRDLQGLLLAVSVCDKLPDGLSAVYCYFDPRESKRSLGVMGVLWQIEQAKQMQLPFLYLGYWISECRKMSYKNQYQPLQWFDGTQWLALSTDC